MPAFATVADLATYLQRDLSGADWATAAQALDIATAAIQSYTRQAIEAVANDAVRLRGTWANEVVLPQRPVTAVSSVSVTEPFAAARTVAAGDYVWRQGGLLLSRAPGHWGGPAAEVSVTYSHGFAAIPDDIRGVCLTAAARLMANPEAIRSEQVGNYSVTHGGAGGDLIGTLAQSEQRDLNRYRQRVWSG